MRRRVGRFLLTSHRFGPRSSDSKSSTSGDGDGSSDTEVISHASLVSCMKWREGPSSGGWRGIERKGGSHDGGSMAFAMTTVTESDVDGITMR